MKTARERFLDAFDQLDSVTRRALIIIVEAVVAGDSRREAVNKAAAFLSKHPGYEDIAQHWLDWEAEA